MNLRLPQLISSKPTILLARSSLYFNIFNDVCHEECQSSTLLTVELVMVQVFTEQASVVSVVGSVSINSSPQILMHVRYRASDVTEMGKLEPEYVRIVLG